MPGTTTALNKIIGQDVTLVASKAATGATALTNWTEIDAEVSIKTYDLTAAAARGDQKRAGRKSAKGSIKGFVGSTETMSNLPQPGDILATLHVQTVTEGADLLVDLFTDVATYGRIMVVKINYKQGDGGGTYGLDFESGY